MVPAPPWGERDHGRNETVEAEPYFLGKENDKGKGVINAPISPKDGEGCSGTRKEETNNHDKRRKGQFVPFQDCFCSSSGERDRGRNERVEA